MKLKVYDKYRCRNNHGLIDLNYKGHWVVLGDTGFTLGGKDCTEAEAADVGISELSFIRSSLGEGWAVEIVV